MALVGDRERERAAQSLRRHYERGRLTADELSERVELAVGARHARDLHAAVAGLPRAWRDGDELGRVARTAKRVTVLALLGIAWTVFSVVLLVAFAVTALVHGVTTVDAIGFPLAWLVATLLVWRTGRRA